MTQDELAVMDGGRCIFMLRACARSLGQVRPHPAPELQIHADADPKNVFDMERYIKKQGAVVKPTDTFDVIIVRD